MRAHRIKGAKNIRAWVEAFFAKETKAVTRSEKRTPQRNIYIKDLVGNEFNDFVRTPGT